MENRPIQGNALVIVDLQNDFLPGGSLAVPQGDEVVPTLNAYIEAFRSKEWPIIATRDWHPPDHCSFKEQGGIWPPHCIADTPGAGFPPELQLPADAVIISKAGSKEKDAYSGFEGTDLAEHLRRNKITRLYIGGLATDYCVLNTVKDALAEGFQVLLLRDAIRSVNVQPGDGERAKKEMIDLGAQPIDFAMLDEI